MPMQLQGSVEPGFESLQKQLADNLSASADSNAQLCVYVGEQCVVDLWASTTGDSTFDGDTLVNVFSSGKSLESILLGMLVDQADLDFSAPVQAYWPEFRGKSKDKLLVADVMRHEAGLAQLNTSFSPQDLYPSAVHNNTLGQVLETHPLAFPANSVSPREYHAISRGWIANEIFRRVDPEHRTMGEFLRKNLSEPLGLDVHIGLTADEFKGISPIAVRPLRAQLFEGIRPGSFAAKIGQTPAAIFRRFWRMRGTIRNARASRRPLPIQGMAATGVSMFDAESLAKAEIPSAGAKASARGLAKLAAIMANQGQLGGTRILSPAAWEQIHANPIKRKMVVLDTAFTQGGLAQFQRTEAQPQSLEAALNHGREGFFGWMGFGGSVFQWHPDLRIGFAYVPASLNPIDFLNERAKAYQQETLRCVHAMLA